jgi:hypothetical protein
LTASINRHTFTVNLRPGQGVLLDNHRWLHARDTFEGPRQLYRLLGNPLPGLGMHPGIPVKQPTKYSRTPTELAESIRTAEDRR